MRESTVGRSLGIPLPFSLTSLSLRREKHVALRCCRRRAAAARRARPRARYERPLDAQRDALAPALITRSSLFPRSPMDDIISLPFPLFVVAVVAPVMLFALCNWIEGYRVI